MDGEIIPLSKIESVAAANVSRASFLDKVFWGGLLCLVLGAGNTYVENWTVHKGAAVWMVVGVAMIAWALTAKRETNVFSVTVRTPGQELVLLETEDQARAHAARDAISSAMRAAGGGTNG